MLVISRGLDDSIMIGDDIMVTIVDIRPDKVRLGISAPREMSVLRQEVHDAVHAASSKPLEDDVSNRR